jgi:hypothetical protein
MDSRLNNRKVTEKFKKNYLGEDIKGLVKEWVVETQKIHEQTWKDLYTKWKQVHGKKYQVFEVKKGYKYHKIMTAGPGKNKSMFAFIDESGNVYRPKDWSTPENKKCGNIFECHTLEDLKKLYNKL